MTNINAKLITACLLLTSVACSQHQFALVDQSKTFGQSVDYNNKVDVLWVVDNSSSMSQHQQKIAEQVSVFVNALRSTGMDFHIGVTTMDVSSTGEKGRLLSAPTGTPLVLTNSTPNLNSILQTRLQMGDGGSPTERALEATKLALTEPLKSGYNAGFRRFDPADPDPSKSAVLAVIYLSNEDDESGSAVPNPKALFDSLSYQSQYGGKQWVVNFIGTTPDDPACETVPWTKEDGLAYISLANQSGGAVGSICNGDFTTAVANIKGHILTMMTEYFFDRPPNPSTIKVYINGALLPESPVNGWTYHDDRKSLKFHGSGVPPVGSTIHVDYTPGGF